MRAAKIISGGQTGADRAALDFAIRRGLPHRGFCPRGRRAEDGIIPERYQLEETSSADYPQGTRLNVEAAEATVIFHPKGAFSRGSALTAAHAKKAGKPHVVLDAFPDTDADARKLAAFLSEYPISTLNVAGSRESSHPGMYAHVEFVLRSAFNLIRAAEFVGVLKAARGGAWDAEELTRLAGVTRDTLREWRREHKIVWWTDDEGHSHYPRWQFDANYSVRPGVREVLEILRSDDPMHVMSAFLVPQEALQDRTLLELIEAGEPSQALARAREMATPII